MPGIPTKFIIAGKVLERLKADKKLPPELNNADNLPYFYLGAIGASFGDLLPALPETGAVDPNSKYFQSWMPVLGVLAGAPGTPGVYKNLRQLKFTLDKLGVIIDSAIGGDPLAKDVAKINLLLMMDELNALPGIITSLTGAISNLATLRVAIGTSIFQGGPSPKTAPSRGWQVRDTLHQSHTGLFLALLHKTAVNDQQKAYALGVSVGYSADLSGNPYINSVVGGPYRNDWWRHRWISNYVDTWVYGFYQQGGASSVFIDTGSRGVPNPLYTNWPNLCEANLQKKIELPGLSADAIFDNISNSTPVAAILPPSFVDFWINAYKKSYGGADSRIDPAGVQSAYAMTWFILWIETSGQVLPCVPSDQVNYPDSCGSRPPWVAVDGSVAVGGGPAATPPPTSKDTDPSVPEVISGIILALIAAEVYVAAGLLAGVEALAGAAVLIADGLTDPDWDKLRCQLGWSLAYKQNFTNVMHDLLTWAGFGFPYTAALAHNDIVWEGSGRMILTPTDAALATVQSKGTNSNYPASSWDTSGKQSNWGSPPTEPTEENRVFAYPSNPVWPFHFVDGLQPTSPPPLPPGSAPGPRVGDPLQVNKKFALPGRPAMVRDGVEFALRQSQLNFPLVNVNFFGNAVDVSLELIEVVTPQEFMTQDLDFLNWDLDGDPGLEFPTWILRDPLGGPRVSSIPEP
ncbi:MAG TPA: hypothetical protein VK563_09495 [Puia sp.]|nr:hypothetical protein [Puia sp.]